MVAPRPEAAADPGAHPVRDLFAPARRAPRRPRSRPPTPTPTPGSPSSTASRRQATVEGTVNPDFSQVESDAFQVEVNQRFPLFFSEKRPVLHGGDGQLRAGGRRAATRSCARPCTRGASSIPLWGGKTTGTAGKVGFGLLAAGDEAPGRQLVGEPNPFLGERRDFYIARSQLSLGRVELRWARSSPTPSSAAGTTASAARTSRCRTGHHGANATFLATTTEEPDGLSSKHGLGGPGLVLVRHQARPLHHPGGALRPRLPDGHRVPEPGRHHAGLELPRAQLLSGREEAPVVQARSCPSSSPNTGATASRAATSSIFVPGLRMHFTRQGFFRIDGLFGQEPWAQRTFKPRNIRVFGQAQFTRWLNIYAQVERRPLDLLRRGRSVPRPLPLVPYRGEPAAERALQPVGDLRPRGVRPPDRRLARLHRERPQHEDDVPAQPPLLRARARAVRQLARDRAHRLPGLVGAAAGHGRPTRGTGRSSSGRTGTASSSSRRPGAYRTTERGLFFKAVVRASVLGPPPPCDRATNVPTSCRSDPLPSCACR